MSKKKKTTKKVEVEQTNPYTLTEQQYERLSQILSWDNPLHELGTIKDLQEPTVMEVAFKAGEVYSKFEKMIEECSEIINSLDFEDDEEVYVDYNDEEENN